MIKIVYLCLLSFVFHATASKGHPKSLKSAPKKSISIPLHSSKDWQVLTYNGINSNQVEFAPKSLTVKVNKSASPIIYPLKQPVLLKRVKVTGSIEGSIDFKNGKQGEEGFDDYIFRLGLVLKGEKTLGFTQKLAAPKWIKTLFKLAPKGIGVDHIYFLNVGNPKSSVGQKRNHPLSDLLKEEIVSVHNSSTLLIDKKFDVPKEVLALWISTDGDDTNSQFTVQVKSIILN